MISESSGHEDQEQEEDPEQEFVRALETGDRELFGKLVKWLQGRVCRVLLRQGVPKDNVADVCQDAFLRVWQNRRRYDGRSKVSTWIIRIALNLAIDQWWKSGRLPVVQLSDNHGRELRDRDTDHPNAPVRDDEEVRDGTKEELREKAEALIAQRLTDKQKTVLRCELHPDHAGMTDKEKADRCGIKHQDYRTTLSRAKTKLREAASKEEDEK
jgi:RNA polymerase sigma-70 factor (ECF subfamily)